MSGQNYVFFGEYVRELRNSRKLPLRKLAAELDIDPSTLGKIERSSRKPPQEIIEKLAKIFSIDLAKLKTIYLTDKISKEIIDEGLDKDILSAVELKVDILKKRKPFVN
jgi:HTH-type transcriptional regulator, competence development regulator